jgi:hypothetical protein
MRNRDYIHSYTKQFSLPTALPTADLPIVSTLKGGGILNYEEQRIYSQLDKTVESLPLNS